MQWPEGVLPGSLSNFETQARLKRYSLLAQAAVRSGIRNLFLGHHRDDQIETILMRLVRGKGTSIASFQGIASEAPIPAGPETENELLDFENPTSAEHFLQSAQNPKSQQTPTSRSSSTTYPKSINTLSGRISIAPRLDVRLHRPFLRFSKARILATCRANNIPFVSDPTNFDPQITLRNSIRYLRANFRLPRALSEDSILNVHARALDRLSQVELEAQHFFNVAHIVSFDLRSGSLTLNLSKFPELLDSEHLEMHVSFLAQILRLVTPIDDYEMSKSSQQAAASLIFPSASSALGIRRGSAPAASFTINQVLMTKQVQETHSNQPKYVSWRLSRQPFKRDEIQRLSPTFIYRPTTDRNVSTEFWSDWIFWDGRYWIRICGSSIEYLQSCTVRPFQASDAADLRTAIDRQLRETLTNLLHDAAPGKVRYTLPVIADNWGVRAFPTLDFAIPEQWKDGPGNMNSKPGLLSWNVKYKHIGHRAIERLIVHKSARDSIEQPVQST
jgi:tRNA(Ile)-lysidine synthase